MVLEVPIPPLGPSTDHLFNLSLTSLKSWRPLTIPPSVFANSDGSVVNKSRTYSGLIATFISEFLNPRPNKTSLIDASENPLFLPFLTIESIDNPLLKATSGFFNCINCSSVSFISFPLNISDNAVPINSSRVRFWISLAVRSCDILNCSLIRFHIPRSHSSNLLFNEASAIVWPLFPIRIANASLAALTESPLKTFNCFWYSGSCFTNDIPLLYISLPFLVVWR